MKGKGIIYLVFVLCFLSTGCVTSRIPTSKEKLKEELAQTSPGEVNIAPDSGKDDIQQDVKLLKKRRPYNIFSKLFKREEKVSPEEIKEKPIEKPITTEEEKIDEEPVSSKVITKKEVAEEKKTPSYTKETKGKKEVKAQYIPLLETWNGECLIYQLSWNSIDVGKGLLACKDIKNDFGEVCHILGLTIPERSVMGFRMNLFRMDAYIDKKTLRPYYFYQYSKNKNEEEDILEIRFDWKNRRYYTKTRKYEKGRLHKTKEKTQPLPDVAYDSISIFYVIRTLDLDNSSIFKIPIAMKEIWDLTIETIGKRQVNIPGKGKGEVYVLKPQAKSSEGFLTKGSMDLWLTADNKRLPVYLEGRVTLGKARMSLLSEKKIPDGAVLNAETITSIISEIN